MYLRTPASPLVDVTVSPIFFRMVPDRKPRTECACQALAVISSPDVAPAGLRSSSRMMVVLLPSRELMAFGAGLGDFLARVAFLGDGVASCATWAACGASGVGGASAPATKSGVGMATCD